MRLAEAAVLHPALQLDARGFFTKSWEAVQLDELRAPARWTYAAYAHNQHVATLRGMHYQVAPHAEHKLVTCVRGSIYDVIVDVRVGSQTYLQWESVRLDDKTLASVYVPPGFAHGYLTLEADALVSYQISPDHRPESARGIRWDDPSVAIEWPLAPEVISDRDRSYPYLVGGNDP